MATLATSAGTPAPRGIRCDRRANFSRCSSVVRSLAVRIHPGEMALTRDLVRRELLGELPDQHGHRRLAGAVVGLAGDEAVVQGGDEQDRSPALRLDQQVHQPAGEEPRPAQVGRQHLVELARSEVQEPLPGGDPDVVDDQLDGPAPGQVVGQTGDVVGAEVAPEDLEGIGAERQLEPVLVRSITVTAAPAMISHLAIASPIPRAAPVTTARRP
jgi:hypothetical protein